MFINHGEFRVYAPTVPDLLAPPAPPPRPEGDDLATRTAYDTALAVHQTALAKWQAANEPVLKLRTMIANKAVFAKRADGADWYDLTSRMTNGRYALLVEDTVLSVSHDASMFAVIDGMTLIETDQDVALGWVKSGESLTPPPIRAAHIKAEAGRRIEALYPLHKQANIQAAGGSDYYLMRGYIDAIRERSGKLEQTLPRDFSEDRHWPSLGSVQPAAASTQDAESHPVIVNMPATDHSAEIAAINARLASLDQRLSDAFSRMQSVLAGGQ